MMGVIWESMIGVIDYGIQLGKLKFLATESIFEPGEYKSLGREAK